MRRWTCPHNFLCLSRTGDRAEAGNKRRSLIGHYCCVSVAAVELTERRRRSVTTAVIILLQQDIDLHELPWHNERTKLQDARGRQHHLKSLCRGVSSLTHTMHLSCVFRQRFYLWMPNDSRGIIHLIGEMNHSYSASELLSADWCQRSSQESGVAAL